MYISKKYRDQKVLACEILTRIIHSMPAGQALNRYEDMFLEGLVHPEDLVKELIIQEVYKTINLFYLNETITNLVYSFKQLQVAQKLPTSCHPRLSWFSPVSGWWVPTI